MAQKRKSHALALNGFDPKHNFLDPETLSRYVDSAEFKSDLKMYVNESARSFRTDFREFDRKVTKSLTGKKIQLSWITELMPKWASNIVNYLGYKDFQPKLIDMGDDGKAFVLCSPTTHDVGIFFAFAAPEKSDCDGGNLLTDPQGKSYSENTHKASLSEQMDRALKAAGLPQGILFRPYMANWFRADSLTANQSLEISWPDILLDDNDSALALASKILSADHFRYVSKGPSEDDEIESNESSEADEETEDSESSGPQEIRLTQSTTFFRENLEQARQITEALHKQVLLGLEILINERLGADSDLKKEALTVSHNQKIADALFKDGLFVLYRILFMLYAESRKHLPVGHPQYFSFYSLEHLRDWSENFLKKERLGEADGDGTYLWRSLTSTFTLMRRGKELSGQQIISAFNGQLFSPDQAPTFDDGPALRDSAIARLLTTLTRIGGDLNSPRLLFSGLGFEQLGAVYEALLAQKPMIVREDSTWVQAHGGGIGIVTKELSTILKLTEVHPAVADGVARTQQKKAKGTKKSQLKSLDSFGISPERPAYRLAKGLFVVAPLGGQKRQTASFYTPPKLAEFLVKRTLKPLVDGKSPEEILKLRVCEPAVGSGGFLVATLRYMGEKLMEAKIKTNKIRQQATSEFLQECKREVLENCLFAVDINPLSLELCRTSLYLETIVPGRPLPFLHHRLKNGNSLISADLQARFHAVVEPDMEIPALFRIPIEGLKIDNKLWDSWDERQLAFGKPATSEKLREILSKKIKDLSKTETNFFESGGAAWATDAKRKVGNLLNNARTAILEFEQHQSESTIVDANDERFRDWQNWIPEMDKILIEANEITVDKALHRQRQLALIRELGPKVYKARVRNQRSALRLKALGDIWCSFWFWPPSEVGQLPTYQIFKELIDWLLDEKTLERGTKPKTLSESAFRVLKVACRTAREHRFFHWDLEFAQVFANPEKMNAPGAFARPGFDGFISNPPWKIVGVKDKEVYPIFDPGFMSTKAANKTARINTLYKHVPQAADYWFRQFSNSARLSALWKSGFCSSVGSEGKNDLATLFVMGAEDKLCAHGRVGMLVSRSAVFVNSGTKALRERFFREWGLREAISFSNALNIFEIDNRFDFTALIGEKSKSPNTPRFVHAVIDINELDSVARNLDSRDVARIEHGHRPVELELRTIERFFSRETLSIPGLTDPRQLQLAAAIHEASGAVVYLDQIDCNVRQGINQKTGPSRMISEFTENISAKDLPTWQDVISGKSKKWIPLYPGKEYSMLNAGKPENIEQYAIRAKLEEMNIDLTRRRVVWRNISQGSNQRTMVTCLLPAHTYINHSSFEIHLEENIEAMAIMLGTLPNDYLIKFQGGSNRTLGQVSALPIANYQSGALTEAVRLLQAGPPSQNTLVSLDVLAWIHYTAKQDISRDLFIWALESQFSTLKRNSPEYFADLIKKFDLFSQDENLRKIDPRPLFRLRDPERNTEETPRKPKVPALKGKGNT